MSKAWLATNFNPYQRQVLTDALAIAQGYDLQIYAVGGIVRDWLLLSQLISHPATNPAIANPEWPDLDLVVAGRDRAGILIAIALHRLYPASQLQIHEKFQTAELIWQVAATGHNFTLDLATARTEIYSYPGANPQVEAASLLQDLQRRDFTINAIAIPLTTQDHLEIIDPHQGISDLDQKQIRAIRPGSFIEDPRRIYRAVRFAVRFSFQLHPHTELEIRQTTASGIHAGIGGSRLKAEIYYLLAFSPAQTSQMWRSLAGLGGLGCIYDPFPLDPRFKTSWQRWQRWQYWFPSFFGDFSQQAPERNFLFLLSDLGRLFAQTPNQAPNLQLSGLQLSQLSQVGQLTRAEFCYSHSASRLVKQLEKFHPLSLLIHATKTSDRYQRRLIWQYFHQWRQIQSPLDGTALIQLGCPRGKFVGELLQLLRTAALENQIGSLDQAKQLAQDWIKAASSPH
ncbi:MAG: hypothetical protein SFT94_01275 [Pseudanabaenaceae cyanobacterium bins.68]|nr:hypothetical protein [Pseudanabaenaceae cyanobacterium bins.68]